ncbi:hypothetical protein FZEAL_10452 [Fusarium zealandicum]|uniref:Uncharacterized protein n=1 Tax=Fusarium zealandicum TaxID=1053134 RepID=A0A8H4U194_9HYPO|nr:hypothetical protein FZEAL_10452 [Fusarium zealandicum]
MPSVSDRRSHDLSNRLVQGTPTGFPSVLALELEDEEPYIHASMTHHILEHAPGRKRPLRTVPGRTPPYLGRPPASSCVSAPRQCQIANPHWGATEKSTFWALGALLPVGAGHWATAAREMHLPGATDKAAETAENLAPCTLVRSVPPPLDVFDPGLATCFFWPWFLHPPVINPNP